MTFTELRFLPFFLAVLAVHYLLASQQHRKVWLLFASAVFYGAWDARFLALLAFSIALDYWCGAQIAAAVDPRRRRGWLVASLAGNLGVLAAFKYYGFFAASLERLLGWLGLPCALPVLELILPVGISFYTFQTLSYVIDVYRRELAPAQSLLDFALFVAFFPQLVAGPIVRAREFLPQLAGKREFRDVAVRQCLWLFLVGFAKKACLADQVAGAADVVFAAPLAFDRASNALAVLLFHAQVYCDFSGYSDMAIASAGLLGYRLPRNFDFPYLATSLAGFWRRWHMSLSSWLRDYVYFPLGGSRRGPSRAAVNLLATMILCGLWHGAAWHFVLFGAWHGSFLAGGRALGRALPAPAEWLRIGGGFLATSAVVLLGWPLFRCADVASATSMVSVLVLGGGGSAALPAAWWFGVLLFAVGHGAAFLLRDSTALERVSPWVFAPAFGAAAAVVLQFATVQHAPFIYFQF